MLNQFFHEIYVSDPSTILLIMAAALPIFSAIGALIDKQMRVIGSVMMLVSVAAILYVTVFTRIGSETGLHLIPFSSFAYARENAELYRSMLMNVFLFFPLGLALPFATEGSIRRRLLLTALIGFLLSVTVEAVQYFAALGYTETDDVICNTLGAAVGSCAYPLSRLFIRLFTRQKDSTDNGKERAL